MGEHTPGSWSLFEYEGAIHILSDGDDISVAVVTPADGRYPHLPTPSQHRANVALIAAAPELLEMTRRYASECAECDGKGNCPPIDDDGFKISGPNVGCPECADVRALISRAEGSGNG